MFTISVAIIVALVACLVPISGFFVLYFWKFKSFPEIKINIKHLNLGDHAVDIAVSPMPEKDLAQLLDELKESNDSLSDALGDWHVLMGQPENDEKHGGK